MQKFVLVLASLVTGVMVIVLVASLPVQGPLFP